MPAPRSRDSTRALVRTSPRDSSGWACRSRWSSRSRGARESMPAHRSASRVSSLMSGRTLPARLLRLLCAIAAVRTAQIAQGPAYAVRSEGLAGDVEAPDVAQGVADLAAGGAQPQRFAHGVEQVVGAAGGV